MNNNTTEKYLGPMEIVIVVGFVIICCAIDNISCTLKRIEQILKNKK